MTSSTESLVKFFKIKIFLKQVICYTNSLLHYLHEFVGTFDTVLSLRHTVEPLLSSHPLGNGRIGALWIFFTIKFSTSNHGERIIINMWMFLPGVPFCHRIVPVIAFSQTRQTTCMTFQWPFNRGKDNRKTLIRLIKRWPQPLNRDGWVKGFLYAVFYRQLFWVFGNGHLESFNCSTNS